MRGKAHPQILKVLSTSTSPDSQRSFILLLHQYSIATIQTSSRSSQKPTYHLLIRSKLPNNHQHASFSSRNLLRRTLSRQRCPPHLLLRRTQRSCHQSCRSTHQTRYVKGQLPKEDGPCQQEGRTRSIPRSQHSLGTYPSFYQHRTMSLTKLVIECGLKDRRLCYAMI